MDRSQSRAASVLGQLQHDDEHTGLWFRVDVAAPFVVQFLEHVRRMQDGVDLGRGAWLEFNWRRPLEDDDYVSDISAHAPQTLEVLSCDDRARELMATVTVEPVDSASCLVSYWKEGPRGRRRGGSAVAHAEPDGGTMAWADCCASGGQRQPNTS